MKIITKKRILIFSGVFLLVVAYFSPQAYKYYQIRKQANAYGLYFPVQLGLVGVMMTPCMVSCNGACCSGGTLCSSLDSARCASYQEVKGTPVGGNANMALFQTFALNVAGVKPGGQMIAGCPGPTFCDVNMVVAGDVSCYGAACITPHPGGQGR